MAGTNARAPRNSVKSWVASATALLLGVGSLTLAAATIGAAPAEADVANSNGLATITVSIDNYAPEIFDRATVTATVTGDNISNCEVLPTVSYTDSQANSGTLTTTGWNGSSFTFSYQSAPLQNAESFASTLTVQGDCVNPAGEWGDPSATTDSAQVENYLTTLHGTTRYEKSDNSNQTFAPGVVVDLMDVALGVSGTPVATTTSDAYGDFDMSAPLTTVSDLDTNYIFRYTYPGGRIFYWYRTSDISPTAWDASGETVTVSSVRGWRTLNENVDGYASYGSPLTVAADSLTPGPADPIVFTATITGSADMDCAANPPTFSWSDDRGDDAQAFTTQTQSGYGSSATYSFAALGAGGSLTFTAHATAGCLGDAVYDASVTVEVPASAPTGRYTISGYSYQWDNLVATAVPSTVVALMDVTGGAIGTPVVTTISASDGSYSLTAPSGSGDSTRSYKIRFTYPDSTILFYASAVADDTQSPTYWSAATEGGPSTWTAGSYNAYLGETARWSISLGTMTIGVPYDQTFTMPVGQPWNWNYGGRVLVEGSLPDGLNYQVLNQWSNGQPPSLRIYGTPTTVGDSSTPIRGQDDHSGDVTTALNFHIVAPGSEPSTPAATDASITLGFGIGEEVAGGAATITGDGMEVGADYTIILRSTPILLASGQVAVNGSILSTVTIPSGLEVGWHSITLTSTAGNGTPYVKVIWFHIGVNGTLSAVSSTEPRDVLAYTGGGAPGGGIALGAALFVAGTLLVVAARRRRPIGE